MWRGEILVEQAGGTSMYIQTRQGLGQQQLPLGQGTPCWPDELPSELFPVQALTEFHFRESKLRTRHRTWIKYHSFLPS